jgi:hypothetical protein
MVFYYEILNKREAACRLGLTTVAHAWTVLQQDSQHSENVRIVMHAIIDNVKLWYNNNNEEARKEIFDCLFVFS